ncbi:hypothetical protein QBC35DRAFT_457544 [Podospora australis]|uniref:Uncharacterized protein n=1 Tax=Podospora australis TaxID=1536484 RepID=A0AAN6WI41_9PEZI|nr:hypothetical protein QBC35DRAFT_457544 [Podospora australis]
MNSSAPPPSTPLTYDDYTVGWVCAVDCETKAAEFMLEARHRDKNGHLLGTIHGYNVAITW